MKILVLGGNGMLGHKLTEVLGKHFDVYATVRSESETLVEAGIVDKDHLLTGVDVTRFGALSDLIVKIKPDCLINAVGVIKHRKESKDTLLSIDINAALPHRLAAVASEIDSRFITFSTDCVFKGDRGNYTEEDETDAADVYGRTKALGEVSGKGCLTIRTSIIGRELEGQRSLVEWFLSQEGGSVFGFSNAIYSGFTTLEMAAIVRDLIENRADLEGLFHVSSEPIDKFELLQQIKNEFGCNIEITRDETFKIDRSLDSGVFRKAASFKPKPWPEMIRELARDSEKKYKAWRKLTF